MEPTIIDGARMTDRAAAHDHLAEQLTLPGWYGRNLDALYDLLTERGETRLTLLHPEALSAWDYGAAILQTLRDAAADNPRLELEELSET